MVSLKPQNEMFYAMKTIKMQELFSKNLEIFEKDKITEREIGKLGRNCSFLVETYAGFKNKVIIFSNTSFNFHVKLNNTNFRRVTCFT